MPAHKTYYIPGLGVCDVSENGKDKIVIEVLTQRSDLDRLQAQELLSMAGCVECQRANTESVGDDYLCIECRESKGEVSFWPTWDISLDSP